MQRPASFYAELAEIAREAYLRDRKRAIRETVELVICFTAFMGVLRLCGIMGWGW